MQDADLAGVVQLISERASATVAVVSQLMDVQTAASPGLPPEKAAALVRDHVVHPRLGQVLRASRLSQRALRLPNVGGVPAIIVAPILVGDEVPSYLITLDPAEESFGEDMSLLVTEHAATICGVILGRERVVAAAARRVRDDLVEGLLLGRGRDAGDAARWAAHLGYDPTRSHNVAAIAFELPPGAGRRRRGAAAADQGVHRALHDHPRAGGHRLRPRGRGGRGRRGGARPAQARPGVPGPARRAVPRREGRHRDRRAVQGPRGDRQVLRPGAPHHADAVAARQDRRCRRVRGPGHPPAATAGAGPRPSCGRSPPRSSASSATTSTSTSRSTCPRSPATSGRTTARSARPGCCTSTRTRWPTVSSGSRRSPGCGWTTTGTG